ncbi:MAG: hypothetical protein ACKOE3_12755, partial [Betaproteobacteria bacterium]
MRHRTGHLAHRHQAAGDLGLLGLLRGGFIEQGRTLTGDRPEITLMQWLSSTGQVRLSFDPNPMVGEAQPEATFELQGAARKLAGPAVQGFL